MVITAKYHSVSIVKALHHYTAGRSHIAMPTESPNILGYCFIDCIQLINII